MWSLLAAWSFATSRRLFQIGILLGGIGSGFIGVGGAGMLLRRRPAAPAAPAAPSAGTPAAAPRSGGVLVSPALIIASILLVAGFILMILSVHFGVSPWSPRPS